MDDITLTKMEAKRDEIEAEIYIELFKVIDKFDEKYGKEFFIDLTEAYCCGGLEVLIKGAWSEEATRNIEEYRKKERDRIDASIRKHIKEREKNG